METNRTLIFGDFKDIFSEYPDNYFDLIITDPPYGIGENSKKTQARKRKNAYIENKETNWHSSRHSAPVLNINYNWDTKLSTEHIKELFRVSKNQIIFGANYYSNLLPPSSCWIVWDKKNGKSDFADCELIYTSFKQATRIFSYRWNGMLQEDMKHKEKRVYPTQKPIALYQYLLEKFAQPNFKVCDPCCGSGTIFAACNKLPELNLNCTGIDLNTDACAIICERGNLNYC